jgi:hypothetical protein
MANPSPIAAAFNTILARMKLSATDDDAFDRHQR